MSKNNASFHRGENRTKFVRNRDIVLKGKEIKKESHILHKTCEGICPRCIEKMQWRFQYNRYKPLKSIGNCQGCKRKCVTKAYRTMCDACASSKKLCSSCCCNLDEAIAEAAKHKAKSITDDVPENGDGTATAPEPANDEGAMEEDEEEEENDEEGDDEEDLTGAGKRCFEEWNEKKFVEIASTKYSKQRKVGSDDTVS
eukprot:gene11963-25060_t